MPSVAFCFTIMQNVIMLSVVVLSVVAPNEVALLNDKPQYCRYDE